MGYKYESLEELRKKKAMLKKEILEIEDLLTFENSKESLSVLTNGFTDKYLKEKTDAHGDSKIALNTNQIIKEVSKNVKDSVLNRHSVYDFTKSDAGLNVIENAIKIGAISFVGNYAKKNLNNRSWKKKAIGLALIYVAPIALKYIRKKLENYQRNRTTSSMEQLI